MIRSWPRVRRSVLENLAHLFFDTVSPAVAEHMNPFLVEVDILDLQKLVDKSDDVVITVKMAAELLYLGAEGVVLGCQMAVSATVDLWAEALSWWKSTLLVSLPC